MRFSKIDGADNLWPIPMKWLSASCVVGIGLALTLPPTTARAALFAYDGFAIINANGAGNTFYDLDLNTANPNFSGATFTINFGQTLLLGGQVKTDPGGGNPSSWGADWARIYYSIDGGAFVSLNLPVTTGSTGDWFEQFEESNAANMINVANGLSVGNHTLTIFIQAHDNTQPADGYLSAGGLNYTATISVVPEPTQMALGIFGVIGGVGGLWRWQRSRVTA